jgi:hypothetical protein
MLPITTSLVWYPHTEKPAERLIVMIAVDLGPETPPEDSRIEPMFGLHMWDAGQFFGLTNGKTLADENYFWAPVFDAVNQLEEAVMNQTADIVKGC